MKNEIDVLPDIQHNSFILPTPRPYEFVDVKEQQAYEEFHYEYSYDSQGNCCLKKSASRVLSNYR